MKKTLSILFCILAASAALMAQPKLKGQVSVAKPAAFDRDILKESDTRNILKPPYGQDARKTGLSYWVVFSDREGNPVYAAPDGKTPCGSLHIGEKLYIAEIQDGYALVFYDPKNDFPRISANAQSKGWIPMKNLLLWDKGLSDDIGISQKAVICADLDKKGNIKDDAERQRFDSPVGGSGLKISTDMTFYYILKQTGTRFLLGKNARINSASDLYGWVEESSFVHWNYRTCLEPTWDIDDVQYFTSKYVQWRVYPNRDKMTGDAPNQQVYSTEKRVRTEKTPQYAEEYQYRTMPVAYLRYPILDGGDDQTYYCTTFGRLGTGSGKSAASAKKTPSIDEDHRIAAGKLDQRRKVNIVIAIDGTSSMKAYFKSVQNALNEVEKFFTGDQVNVGVTIYRDKEDGDFVTESFPATGGFTQPKNQNLRKWLASGGEYGVKSVAKGAQESVFYGIETAINQFFPAGKDMKLQSNILLVIGDCGDNGKFGITRQEIIDKLAAQNISLMAFQVTNRDTEDYSSFNDQLTSLMKASVQKRYDMISKNPQRIEPQVLENGRGYNMINKNNKVDLFLGMHRFNPVKNQSMQVDDLTASIEEILGIWKSSVDYLTTIAANFVDHGAEESFSEDNVVGNQLVMDAIIAMLGGDKARVERLAKQNSLIAFRGYTYKQKDTRDMFKVVVFFPAGELKNLVRSMDKVYEASQNETNDRRPYYDAMMSLARTAVAQDQISTTSYYSILAKVFGLVNYTPEHGYTLDDIVDPNVVPYKEYRKIVKRMQTSLEFLRNVTSTDYPFLLTYTANNDKYYWLPSEYLPL